MWRWLEGRIKWGETVVAFVVAAGAPGPMEELAVDVDYQVTTRDRSEGS